ncbi:MAG: ATP-binding protein [Actinomycetota bacterium]
MVEPRRRAVPIAAMLLGILLLPATAAIAIQQHSRATSALEHSLTQEAKEKAAALRSYFERARAILLLTANNPAFAEFYEAPGDRETKIEQGGPVVDQINAALVYLNNLYPDSIGEACFIDRTGPENARAVRGVAAPVGELSPDESSNPFFGPTFTLPVGLVYQAQPYVSPDTGEWVIANSTIVPMSRSPRQSIVHFEVTIESFRKAAVAARSDVSIQVVDARTGSVVIDSRFPQAIGAPLGRPDDRRFVSAVREADGSGTLGVHGLRIAYERFPVGNGNANDWYVVASSEEPSGLFAGLGPAEMVLGALGLLLFLAGLMGHRIALRAEAERLARLEDDLEQGHQIEEALRRALEREHEAAESLRMLDDMKNGFLQAVSHELRTPLTSILGYAHTLKQVDVQSAETSPVDTQEALDRLVANANKLNRLLSDLLDLDRLGRGIIAPQLRPTDLRELARAVLQDLDLGGRSVRIEASRVVCAVDAPKVERIIENLVINAMKHTARDATIWVRIQDVGGGALIKVEDDGSGIPDGLKEAIFKPFTQGPSHSSHSQGTGIGLSLVARFAQLHGGRAWVEDRPGGGASFQVFLPNARTDAESQSPEKEGARPEWAEHLRVTDRSLG